MSASNDVLPLYVVLKGKSIPKDVEHLVSERVVIAANQTAWLTEQTFLNWVEKVWAPYATKFPRSLLIMDSFKVHKLPSILAKLEHYKTDVLFIPPGLTFFSQPCDVYLNKPVKDSIRKSWQEFMANQEPDATGNFLKYFFFNFVLR